MANTNVTILGIGEMGERIASNLLTAGYQVHIWNRTFARCRTLIERGAHAYPSPKDAATQSDIVIAMLRDDHASEYVWLDEEMGALTALSPKSIAVECSTLSHHWCTTLATHMASANIPFIDAPVVGSRPQAEAAQLIHLVGGNEDTVEQAREVLEVSAKHVHYLGENGKGMAMKLAVNMLFSTQVGVLGELLCMLKHKGFDWSESARVLGQLPVTSPAASGALNLMASENYVPLFPIHLVHKDLGYTLQMAQDDNAKQPFTSLTHQLFQNGVDQGLGNENIHALIKFFDAAPLK